MHVNVQHAGATVSYAYHEGRDEYNISGYMVYINQFLGKNVNSHDKEKTPQDKPLAVKRTETQSSLPHLPQPIFVRSP